MPFILPTLDPTKPETLKTAIEQMTRYMNQLEATITRMATAPASQPLTLAQIRAGLSATGSHPLNVTGLPGTLTQNQPSGTP